VSAESPIADARTTHNATRSEIELQEKKTQAEIKKLAQKKVRESARWGALIELMHE
jgi:hypothetical protein